MCDIDITIPASSLTYYSISDDSYCYSSNTVTINRNPSGSINFVSTSDAKYTPKKIIFNGPATIVFWKDGTKTIVKRAKKDKDNKYNAFCAALAKKIFKSNSRVNSIVKNGIEEK